ncbi:MAG: hypothetical protein CK431_10005 [Mycobacterium sp.]|nr:MAG: hypothetical protein CK431_10005 [Mycobacterium sp.]
MPGNDASQGEAALQDGVMASTRVPASRGGRYVVGRLPDGSVNVAYGKNTINFGSKSDVAGVFKELYDALYAGDTNTSKENK